MSLNEWMAGQLVAVRDEIRRDDRRGALAKLISVLAELSDEIHPVLQRDVTTPLAELAGDVGDLGRGRRVEWATRCWRRTDRGAYARLQQGRECQDLKEWLVRQLVAIARRIWNGDRRGAVVELIGTARECASVLIESESKHSTVRALDDLLKEVLSLYKGKQPEWLLPDIPPDEDGELKRGPKLSRFSEQVRRTLIAQAYRRHRKFGGTVRAATHAICRRAGCTQRELRTWCQHLGGDRRSAEERALASEVLGWLDDYVRGREGRRGRARAAGRRLRLRRLAVRGQRGGGGGLGAACRPRRDGLA
jgi:hypothetical protein